MENRKIKFRAWNRFSKKMLPWDKLCKTPIQLSQILTGHLRHITAMQYTGLKDKNGKEIYESDIVKNLRCKQDEENESYEETHYVFFSRGGFHATSSFSTWYTDEKGYLLKRLWCSQGDLFVGNIYYKQYDIEIIGNIYENPELLK